MNKRIRYKQDVDGAMISTRVIATASGEVIVRYFEDSRTVLVVDPNTTRVLHTFVGADNHSLKKEIKAKLIEMGAVFEPETRKGKHKGEDTESNSV